MSVLIIEVFLESPQTLTFSSNLGCAVQLGSDLMVETLNQ